MSMQLTYPTCQHRKDLAVGTGFAKVLYKQSTSLATAIFFELPSEFGYSDFCNIWLQSLIF